MIDLFYECKENDIGNYANDKTPYSCVTDIPTVIFELQSISTKAFNWFGNNYMRANPEKCHLLLSTKSPGVVSINGIEITTRTAENLLNITIYSDVNLENHLYAIYNKVRGKIMLLGGMPIICPSKIIEQLLNVNYCPLIWIFYS